MLLVELLRTWRTLVWSRMYEAKGERVARTTLRLSIGLRREIVNFALLRVLPSTIGDRMACKTCEQLERAVAAARSPDPPEILRGLAEAGLRNRGRQREERLLKAEADLLKHQGSPSHAERVQRYEEQ